MALPTMIGGQSSRYPAIRGNLPPMAGGKSTRYPGNPGSGYQQTPYKPVPATKQQAGAATTITPPVNNVPANPYDISGDPILQRVLGANVNKLNIAAGQKTEDEKKNLLGYGVTTLAQQMFGSDKAFVDAVAGNPFSVMAQIAHQYEGAGGQINQANEAENANNLFFSSHRTDQVLPELYRQRASSEYDATQQLQDAISQIGRAYTGVQQQAITDENAARNDAANRATQAALASGYGPGSSTGSGTYGPSYQVGSMTTYWPGKA